MRKQTKLWKCKDGTKVRICDMTDSHLNNTINMLERYTSAMERNMYHLSNFFTGDLASDMIEDQIMWMEQNRGFDPSEFAPLYDNLIDERERRELEFINV